MKILIDIPKKYVKIGASLMEAMDDDGISESEIQEIVDSTSDEPFEVCLNEFKDPENGKSMMIALAMLAIMQKIGKE